LAKNLDNFLIAKEHQTRIITVYFHPAHSPLSPTCLNNIKARKVIQITIKSSSRLKATTSEAIYLTLHLLKESYNLNISKKLHRV